MDIYVARQPVFRPNASLFGYELLYRSDERNHFDPSTDGSMATCTLLSNIEAEFGLHNLTGGAYAFINFTTELLMLDRLSWLDAGSIIIEILESVRPDEALLASLSRLKKKGFTLALDDYTGDPSLDELVELCDIIKVDLRLASPKQQRAIAARLAPDKQLVAEKVETAEEFERAKAWGYVLFQGYYFSKPVLLSQRPHKAASVSWMRLWKAVQRPDMDFDELTEIIRLDANLTYKLLLRANTLRYYRHNRISSIKHALLHFGMEEVQRWVMAVLLQDLNGGTGDELAKRALARASFAERLAEETGSRDLREDAFLVGIFSVFDSDGELRSLFDAIHLPVRVREALFEKKGFLSDLLLFISAYENEDRTAMDTFLHANHIHPNRASMLYLQSVNYAEHALGGGAPPGRQSNMHSALDLLRDL